MSGEIEPVADWRGSTLVTDLYQLTMLQSYFTEGMNDTAVFEFFVRRLPAGRNFLVAAGLAQVCDYLANLSFNTHDLQALRQTALFSNPFMEQLAQLRFTGDVDAMPEGTPFFAAEPVLRITAPLPEAQLVESRLMNLMHLQTLIASKAARCTLAAGGRNLVDFGMRRSHGAEAAVYAARASYMAGFAGTATVAAQPLFGIPLFGTMAHSFVQAHDSEMAAFAHFAREHRGPVVLLIDTYDTRAGARQVVELARQLALEGVSVASVRIDSGDYAVVSAEVRSILDDGGLQDVGIFVSGGLDEWQVARLVAADAPIDGFGIGTALNVSEDAPALDCVYKLQEYAGQPRRKHSPGKATWPGRKQVYRCLDRDGCYQRDVLTLADDVVPGHGQPCTPLLQPVMRSGKLVGAPEDLSVVRARVASELGKLPPALRSLEPCADYPVEVAPALLHFTHDTDEWLRRSVVGGVGNAE